MFKPAPFMLAMVVFMLSIDWIVIDSFSLPTIGSLLVVISISFTVDSAKTLRKHLANVNPDNAATSLVTARAFSISRNPMYLGMTSFLVGFAVLTGVIANLIAPVIYIVWIHFKYVVPENQAMLKEFPEYKAYMQKVRAWI